MATIRPEAREARRNHASCFKAQKTEDWMADFTGVIVLESGEKFWVNLYEKKTNQGDIYFAVVLKPKQVEE